jgi:hypothetical protein
VCIIGAWLKKFARGLAGLPRDGRQALMVPSSPGPRDVIVRRTTFPDGSLIGFKIFIDEQEVFTSVDRRAAITLACSIAKEHQVKCFLQNDVGVYVLDCDDQHFKGDE